MRITDGRLADGQPARCRLYHGVGAHAALLKGQRNRERLHGGARLEGIGQCAVAQLRTHEFRAVVRVVGRQVDHGQHLTRRDIQHEHRRRLGVMGLHCRRQLGKSLALDASIHREHQVMAVLRRLDRLHVLDDLPAAVAERSKQNQSACRTV